MDNLNPYRASGTFDGISYVERDADRHLRLEIDKNQRYPYFLAPRQSGKSSLILHTIRSLDKSLFTCIFIDISKFPDSCFSSYDAFMQYFISKYIDASIPENHVSKDFDLTSSLKKMSAADGGRVLIFIDEIDALLGSEFKDSFLSLIRAVYNERPWEPELVNIQFILSGTVQSVLLISDPYRSPFNVGIPIKLSDFTLDHVYEISVHLDLNDKETEAIIVEKIYQQAKGSIYLTQLLLENVWEKYIKLGYENITEKDIDAIVHDIIHESSRNIHFLNIYNSIAQADSMQKTLKKVISGQSVDRNQEEKLRIIGIINDELSFRNKIYEKVFGPGGALQLIEAYNVVENHKRAQSRHEGTDIFLSYVDSDLERIQPLIQALENSGWSVWWDRAIPLGQRFNQVVESALDAARCVIVVWSEASVQSRWVEAEAVEGMRREILVPVLIDEVQVPLVFRQLQTAELQGWDGDLSDPQFTRIVETVEAQIDQPQEAPEVMADVVSDGELVVESPITVESLSENNIDKSEMIPDLSVKSKRSPLFRTIILTVNLLLILSGAFWLLKMQSVTTNLPIEGSVTTHALTIKATPPDSIVSLLDVDILYHPGTKLAPGTYTIRVERNGYKTIERPVVIHDTPVTFEVELDRLEASETLKNSIGMSFVFVPAGSFQMGSSAPDASADERPVHTVRLSNSFYLGKYEVTQREWQTVMGDNPSQFKGDNLPVESVSWHDVQEFISKLNEKERTKVYRLPTEAEWEYAARSGTETSYSFGDNPDQLLMYAWYQENADRRTHRVGQLRPNAWGLHDVHGNVSEWVKDWYGIYVTDTVMNPTGPAEGTMRVVRGGSWLNSPEFCRVAHRNSQEPSRRDVYVGFRLLKAVE